ncbi:MAG: methylated-DNA--[protein]-cysteine S-methyltransferase [Betaproteobacteria bacterium]
MSGAPAERASTYAARMRTPFATLGIATDARAVTRVRYLSASEPELAPVDAVAARAVRELERYLVDPHFRFTVPLAPPGTLFQRRVWDVIGTIPAGHSRTYGELAQKVVTAARAVGQACGANPIALLIPCHRVVGGLGALGGFMGRSGERDDTTHDLFAWEGAANPERVYPSAIKRWLLTHEGYRFGR